MEQANTPAVEATETPMIPVESSNIAAVGYNAETSVLSIAFKDDSIWGYSGVPQTVASEIMAADSVGKYYHANIKKKYDSERLDTKPPLPESPEQVEDAVGNSPEVAAGQPTPAGSAPDPVLDDAGNEHPMEASGDLASTMSDAEIEQSLEDAPGNDVGNIPAEPSTQGGEEAQNQAETEVPTETPDAPVDSDNSLDVKSWGSEPSGGIRIDLNNGDSLFYPDAPVELLQGLSSAGNATRYYQAQIVPNYESKLSA